MKPQKSLPRHQSTAQPQTPMPDHNPGAPMKGPAASGHAAKQAEHATHGGQLPQNQQRLGQHQNSRKQPRTR